MAERFLRARDVAGLVGLSESEVWQRVSEGRLPRPMQLGPKYTRWALSEIDAWMRERVATAPRPRTPAERAS